MATLYKANGEETEVTPKNKKNFTYRELKEFVGGFIEIVRTPDGRLIILNEEGKLENLPLNKKVTGIYANSNDFIVGDALVCESDQVL